MEGRISRKNLSQFYTGCADFLSCGYSPITTTYRQSVVICGEKNTPYELMYLNTWSPVGDAVIEPLGGIVLLAEELHLGWILRVYILISLPSVSCV